MNNTLKEINVLYVSSGSGEDWIVQNQSLIGLIKWVTLGISSNSSLWRIISGLFVAQRLTNFDVVVSNEYFIAFGINLRLRLTRCNTKHIVWGLNQSRRLLDYPGLKGIVSWVFNRSDVIVTHSVREADIFSKVHHIDRNRFRFAHWGYDLPAITPSLFSKKKSEYVCMIGRNNRDIETFCEGLKGTGLQGVVITSALSDNETERLQKSGVEIHQDLDFNTCLDCIRHSFANVILLKDDLRGAGHITLVSAMFLGVPQIISCAAVLEDYFIHEEHGLMIPIGSAHAFRSALDKLHKNPELKQKMGHSSQEYALKNFTNNAIAEHFVSIVGEEFNHL